MLWVVVLAVCVTIVLMCLVMVLRKVVTMTSAKLEVCTGVVSDVVSCVSNDNVYGIDGCERRPVVEERSSDESEIIKCARDRGIYVGGRCVTGPLARQILRALDVKR